MRRTRAHQRSETWLLAELETRFRPGRRATVLGYLWWWRYELAIVAGLAGTLIVLVRALGAGPTILGTLATIGVCCCWPPTRQAVVTTAWRIITPHRLRAGFVQARIHSRSGRLPAILRTTRQPFGERVRLWCPAGVVAADVRSARDILAAACWAADIRVTGDPGHAHLLTLDVIRRSGPPEVPRHPQDHCSRNENRPPGPFTMPDSPRRLDGPADYGSAH
ncbi:MAG: hypothetical protein ABR926_23370 [Streptosporangiaceae bacterium]|jgi:hypothetical protein